MTWTWVTGSWLCALPTGTSSLQNQQVRLEFPQPEFQAIWPCRLVWAQSFCGQSFTLQTSLLVDFIRSSQCVLISFPYILVSNFLTQIYNCVMFLYAGVLDKECAAALSIYHPQQQSTVSKMMSSCFCTEQSSQCSDELLGQMYAAKCCYQAAKKAR